MPEVQIVVIGADSTAQKFASMLGRTFPTGWSTDYSEITITGIFPKLAIVIDKQEIAKALMAAGVQTAYIGNGEIIDGVVFQLPQAILAEHLISEVKAVFQP